MALRGLAVVLGAALAALAEGSRGGGGSGNVITMSIMGEDEVAEYHRRRRLESLDGDNSSAVGAVGPYAQRRFLQGHVDMSNKAVQEGILEGNTMPLGYYYTRVHVGTPGQIFTVIVDTGSSLLAIPCRGCSRCGKHMNPYFEQSKSSTYREGCSEIPKCQQCSGKQCGYKTHFVEGSSIGGYVVKDQVATLMAGSNTPQFTAEGIFGCQMSETGLFKSQMADGIMGLGYGKYDTLFDSLVNEHKVKNTLSFCVHRSGGYIQFGADAPTAPSTISTPLVPHSKYYVIRIKGMKVGNTDLGLDAKVFNSGHGAIIDSGTSLSYFPRAAYQRMRTVFGQETSSMNLGRAEHIDGADCWRVNKAPGGLASFPTYSVDFDEAGMTEFHPVHYMFNHPQVKNPTHYCYGILDNGQAGLVLGSLFQRHFFMTIDREANRVYMVPDMCGDSGTDEMKGNRAGPPRPPLKGQCMTGQLKQETDLNGGDLGFGEKADNVDKCCESCANTDGCEAFTFVTEASTCWLKGNGYTEKVGVTGVVSGMRSDFVVDRSAVVEPPPPPLPHPLDHVTAPDLTKAADQERALSGNKNLDPSVSVAAQTNGYATPSTYSHPSSDPTIPRGKHNYDYHHPVAEAEYLGYEAEAWLAGHTGQTIKDTNNELWMALICCCGCCVLRRLRRKWKR